MLKIRIAFLSQVTPAIDERCKQPQEPWDPIDPKHIEDLRDEMAQMGFLYGNESERKEALIYSNSSVVIFDELL